MKNADFCKFAYDSLKVAGIFFIIGLSALYIAYQYKNDKYNDDE
jgi:hypothetical protein